MLLTIFTLSFIYIHGFSWIFICYFGVKIAQIIPVLVTVSPSSWFLCPVVRPLSWCGLAPLLMLFCFKHFLPFWNVLWAHFVCLLPKSYRQSFLQGLLCPFTGEGTQKQGVAATKLARCYEVLAMRLWLGLRPLS